MNIVSTNTQFEFVMPLHRKFREASLSCALRHAPLDFYKLLKMLMVKSQRSFEVLIIFAQTNSS